MEIKNILMGIGVIILTIFVIISGFESFHLVPDYADYCFEDVHPLDTRQACESVGGIWIEQTPSEEMVPIGNCRQDPECRTRYNDAKEKRAQIIFISAIPLAILLIVIGALVFSLESVGVGLMGGGVVTLIYGAGNYWRYAENWVRFTSSLVGLVVLIWFAYFLKKIKDKQA